MPLSSRWRCRIARSPSPVFKRASTRSAATNRRIKPRSAASACSGDSTGAAVVAGRRRHQAEPGQTSRPAGKLGGPVEPLLDPQRPDDAPVVPEPEPEPFQRISPERWPPIRPLRKPPAKGQRPRHGRPDCGASLGRPARARQPEELQDQARTQRQCRKAVSGGQKVGHTGQNQQPIEQRPGRIKLNLPQPLRPP